MLTLMSKANGNRKEQTMSDYLLEEFETMGAGEEDET